MDVVFTSPVCFGVCDFGSKYTYPLVYHFAVVPGKNGLFIFSYACYVVVIFGIDGVVITIIHHLFF